MPLYAIFRVGDKKIKSVDQLKGFARHAEREILVPNANLSIKNDRLIGTEKIIDDVKEYIKDVKLRKNSVLARDLVLTASPEFFKNASEELKNKWVQINIKWLKECFGNNCTYATLHKDESTWHISALVVPRFFDEKKQKYILANARYFDGIAKMSAWQDKYATAMQETFKELNRGIKFSKAKHVQIRHFYTLLNKELNENELDNLCAKAKNGELLKSRVKELQETLMKYKNITNKSDSEKNDIRLKYLELKKDKDIFRETIKVISKEYKIPQETIIQVLTTVENKFSQSNEISNKAADRQSSQIELTK